VLLDKFAKDNNFTIILDVSGQSSPVLWAASSVDITKPVVDAYNSESGVAAPAKPATAAKPATPAARTAPKK
jgi:outer membrane protein